MKKKIIFMLYIFSLFVIYGESLRIPDNADSAEISLIGKIELREFFGPPNYGENPDTDKVERHYFVVLDEPIYIEIENVVKKVKELQIIFNTDGPVDISANISYLIYGNIFKADSGHHYSDFLIIATRITKHQPQT
jgi:hypothetical protein